MKATILNVAPPSGDYEEICLTKDGSGVWVKFEDSDSYEYCAVFGGGVTDSTKVTILGTRVFILAHGQGYLFDASAKSLILETKVDDYKDCVADQGTCLFVACTDTEIDIYTDRLAWESPRLALDGIAFLSVENGTVEGEVYTVNDWQPFSLDLKNYDYRCQYDWQGGRMPRG